MLREIDVLRKYLPADNRTSIREGIIHSRKDKPQKQARIQVQKSIVTGLRQLFNNTERQAAPLVQQTTETKPFNLYEGWVRYPEGDHSSLEGVGGNSDHKPAVIPQTTAFLSPDGAVIYMSSNRALELGLIDDYDPSIMKLSEHSMSVVEKHNLDNLQNK